MNAVSNASQVSTILVPRTFDQLVTFAEMAAHSGMVPKDYNGKPGAIMVAVQMGSELGLSPMQSLNSIAVINGRPGIWGDGLLGLCRQSPLCQDVVETLEGDGDERVATCTATRRGSTPCVGTFSVADARRAGLWGKDIWLKYPDRMLQNRARGFALRDAFPDVLRGLKTGEELLDTPRDDFRGTTLDAEPAKSAAPKKPAKDDIGPPKRTWRSLLNDTAGMLSACYDIDSVVAIGELPAVRAALEKGPPPVPAEMRELLADAFARVRPADEDDALDEDGEVDPIDADEALHDTNVAADA